MNLGISHLINKTLVTTTISLIAVVMVLGTVLPAVATPTVELVEDGITPVHGAPLKFVTTENACGLQRVGNVCVAVDHDDDGICDSKAFSIPRAATDKIGIHGTCSFELTPPR